MCAGGDSNPQGLLHTHLKRTRIPVPPPALFDKYTSYLSSKEQSTDVGLLRIEIKVV